MSFLKRLAAFLGGSGPPRSASVYEFAVRCRRCGEVLPGRVNLANDLSADYAEDGAMIYTCRKVLVGKQRCFQANEVTLTFDAARRLTDRQVIGGEFVDDVGESQ